MGLRHRKHRPACSPCCLQARLAGRVCLSMVSAAVVQSAGARTGVASSLRSGLTECFFAMPHTRPTWLPRALTTLCRYSHTSRHENVYLMINELNLCSCLHQCMHCAAPSVAKSPLVGCKPSKTLSPPVQLEYPCLSSYWTSKSIINPHPPTCRQLSACKLPCPLCSCTASLTRQP